MALAVNIMRSAHMPAAMAMGVNGNYVGTALTAAGTTLATALALTADMNVVTTATAGQGVSLYAGMAGDSQVVYNGTTVTIYVYPPSASVALNQLPVGKPAVLPPSTAMEAFTISATQMVGFLSA